MTRWEVFKQDAPGRPHQAVGSVHAADARHALVTAAHVFARRPAAVSLWVAPASSVYSRTAQELLAEARHAPQAPPVPDSAAPSFHVFRKASNRRSMTYVDHVGVFTAACAADALALATRAGAADEALVWWVVPVAAVTASDPADAPAWFEPAQDKTYKQQSMYGGGPRPAARRDP